MQIKPESLTFWQLIQGQLFRIPDYQRAYSWRTKQRRELFDSFVFLLQGSVKVLYDNRLAGIFATKREWAGV